MNGRTWLKAAVGLLIPLAAAWTGAVALLASQQEALIFPVPGGLDQGMLDHAAAEVGARPLRITTEDGEQLYGWHRAAQPRPAAPAVVVYFHGNGEPVSGSMGLMRLAHRLGLDWVAVAWRGYPGSTGQPSEVGLRRDARAVHRYVIQELGFAPDQILLHGRSLGGALAAGLAAEAPIGGLVLESTFSSLLAVAQGRFPWFPVERLLRHRFPTDQVVGRIDVPTLILHGDQDPVVPVSHGRWLAGQIRGAHYVEVPGAGHDRLLPLIDAEARDAWTELSELVRRR